MAQQWSASHGLCLVQSPTLETLRSIHDKKWLEKKRHKPLLSHLDSQIIHSFKELEQLSHKHPGQPWMIKRSWSAAGLGNRAYIPSITSAHFIEKWLAADQALIIQPLLEKKLDFSSLWYLPAQGSAVFLGSTQMLIENGTRYAGCLLQTPEHLFASYPFLWQEHLQEAQALMDQMRSEGYFGYLGLDGMLYETKHGLCQAIIEINLRQTLAMHLHSCAQSLEFAFPVLAQIKTERSKSSSPLFKRKQSLLPASYAIAIELYELHS
jgi:hypothetical protein